MSELSIYLLVDGGEVLLLSPTPMASAACLVSLNPFSALHKPGISLWVRLGFQKFPATKFSPPKAAQSNSKGTKPNSVVCADCDGNGKPLSICFLLWHLDDQSLVSRAALLHPSTVFSLAIPLGAMLRLGYILVQFYVHNAKAVE
ncbi:hypothetical protein CK203_080397 [Vitis vinifera]|uniref:Uncharacterized protein n=1 Tax=Vitis vinifera TaxID=29760 RepID=A0A438F244_VITVI|nr:hypothetical protein CK203_080397 [Vitis vinifera]